MTVLLSDDEPVLASDFEVAYAAPNGAEVRLSLADAWSLALEDALPVRRFVSHKGQKHLPGDWWSATTRSLVGYESWLERDHVMLLDFDQTVTGISSQPFWLFWTTQDGKSRSHAPDYFARRRDGTGVVVDCRPVNRRRPRDLVAFAAARQACEIVGWEYRLEGAADPVLMRNVRWLSGYRHPRYRREQVLAALLEVFVEPVRLIDGVEQVGDPIAVLPTLFHLLWQQELAVDLSLPLHHAVPVSPPEVV
ncbi:TnsA-like heteromeric transposase endonuclease subunit [Nonomuraea maheshkhaliensis]|uniref:TnsA-like heteromeric transposase endonuclease subunit n=1 Tax=Nonomuraea maheshkhaliensis TaxID=419590 RepID=A0ABN2EZB9_9ACTN